MAKRSTTMNRGADDERAAILRKIKKLRRQAADQHQWAASAFFQQLESWIVDRDVRTAAKAGGLGRKKK